MSESRQADGHPSDLIERLAKAMANPLRVRILIELNQRGPMSSSQFFRDCCHDGETPAQVWRQFNQLEKYGLIEEIETRSGGRRRGGVEHFYRALQPAEFDTPSWAVLPGQFKSMITTTVFQAFGERVSQAMNAGTLNARKDRHLTWVTVPLDEAGWERVIARTDSLYHFMRDEAAQAASRLAASGEDPVPATVALFVFESPSQSLATELDD